ncbi:coatomer subunit alpha [Dionaea muscipula]
MAESTGGPVVPSVKSEPTPSTSEAAVNRMVSGVAAAPVQAGEDRLNGDGERGVAAEEEEEDGEVERELLCPICMQMIKDAFLTACGHSFCYMCIATHLRNKNDCPCCDRSLASNHIFPNFALDKLIRKMPCPRFARNTTPFEHLHQALQQGCEVSIKELDGLLSLLAEKKINMERDEAEANMQILFEFLCHLRKLKLEELNEIKNDLQYLTEDIKAVERRRIHLQCMKERHLVRLRMAPLDSATVIAHPFGRDMVIDTPSVYSVQGEIASCHKQGKKDDGNAPSQEFFTSTGFASSELEHLAQSGMITSRKRRIHSQFKELQDCYLQKRRHWAKELYKQEESDRNAANLVGYNPGLEDFQSVLTAFTRYSRMRVVAELRDGDLFHSANIISSIEFDRDDELFATAGVSKQIKVFDFNSVVNDPTNIHCPVVEMTTRSKLLCLSWNKYTKNHIASSDYEGIVTIWDVTTRQSVMECEEHEKRAWSVDFSRTEPSMLVSGSDDCKVKIWCTKQESSVTTIDMRANICSVKFNPGSSIHVAVGSADHHVHYYDLRNISKPLHVFIGHKKAVSYVKFMSNNELTSASTDSTLCLWDVKDNSPLRTYRGHSNVKNFVGLTVNRDYIACGSETNEVFVYHKAISRPAAMHRFSSLESDEIDDNTAPCFISAVCWKNDSLTMLAANSQGTIKVLALTT